MTHQKRLRQLPLHLMLLPGVVFTLIYSYGPMAGLVMAFQNFNFAQGIFKSPWVGLDNFKYVFAMPDIFQVIWNTVFISLLKIIGNLIVPIIFALLLNEVRNRAVKKTVQTIIYLPNFLSWVIIGGIMIDVLSPSTGIVNQLLKAIGVQPVYFLGDPNCFPYTMVVTDVWKNFGFETVIYLASLTGIDPTLYEAARVDGANRWQQTLHVTLPGMVPIILLTTVLSMGNILNAGFDQIFNLYSPQVYSTGDILDTMVYRMGMVDAQYSVATAIGLFKSVVSMVFVVASYILADKAAHYKVL